MSFDQYLHKTSVEFGLSLDQIFQFDENFNLVKSCQKKASQKKLLERILLNLESSQTYFLNEKIASNFLNNLERYVTTICQNEESQVAEVAKKIHELVKRRSTEKLDFFQGEGPKKIKNILNKFSKDILLVEYDLLVGAASFLAKRALQVHSAYKYSAIMEKISNLRKAHPKLLIYDENAYWIDMKKPDCPKELQFFLFIKFHLHHDAELANADEKFIQTIVKNIVRSPNSEFRGFLDATLAIKIIAELMEEWEAMMTQKEKIDQLNALMNKSAASNPNYHTYLQDFNAFPDSFFKIIKVTKISFFNSCQEYKKGAKAIHKDLIEKNIHFKKWYTAIFEKIKEFESIHPEQKSLLPHPEDYGKFHEFINYRDIQTPTEEKINQWKKDFTSEVKKEKKSLKAKVREEKLLSNLEPDIEEERGESFIQSLIETCPFKVKSRITDWFGPQIDELTHLNKESSFIHNFAWAANQVLWEFGLRYPRKNNNGLHEPALAMLCEVEHPLFQKKELFKMTATFDSQHPHKKYDPNWSCYHRTLTRREQDEEIVNEYFANGTHQFIDFPPLLSQRFNVDSSNLDVGFIFPDGSFIESVEGSVITIRDPKHDKGNIKCSLYLYVVR